MNGKKIFYLIFIVFLTANVILLAVSRLYPFIDLPFHLATATIYKYIGQSGNEFANYYHIPVLLKSNIFHLVFTSSIIFENVEIGNKVYHILYVIILPLSVLYLIKQTNGNIFPAIFSFAFLYNHNCSWGFVDFTFSTPLVIFFTALAYRYFTVHRANNFRLYTILIFFVFGIFLVHFQNSLFALLIFFIYSVVNFQKSIRYILLSIFFFIPTLSLMGFVYLIDADKQYQNLTGYFVDYYTKQYFVEFFRRIYELPALDNYHLTSGITAGGIAMVIFLLIILPITFGIKSVISEKKVYLKSANKLIFPVISGFCYFILPYNIPGQNIVYQRFSIYVMISLIIMSSYFKIPEIYSRVYKYAVIIIIAVNTFLNINYFSEFNKENANFTEEIFPNPERGMKLFGMIYDNSFRGRPVYIHFHEYYTIWKKGISGGIIDYRFGYIKRKPETTLEVMPIYREWIGDTRDYNDEYIKMSHLFLRGSEEIKINGFVEVKSNGNWKLLKNENSNY